MINMATLENICELPAIYYLLFMMWMMWDVLLRQDGDCDQFQRVTNSKFCHFTGYVSELMGILVVRSAYITATFHCSHMKLWARIFRGWWTTRIMTFLPSLSRYSIKKRIYFYGGLTGISEKRAIKSLLVYRTASNTTETSAIWEHRVT